MLKYTMSAMFIFIAPGLARSQSYNDAAPPMLAQAPDPRLPRAVATDPPGLTEEQVTRIVDAAITRAMARQQAASMVGSAPATSSASASASPQSSVQYQSPAPVQYQAVGMAPPVQTVNVMTVPGPIHRCVGKLGQRMMAAGQPRVQAVTLQQVQYTTYSLAPTTYAVQPTQYVPYVAPTYTLPAAVAPAKATPQR
jgi:hypothetical protein